MVYRPSILWIPNGMGRRSSNHTFGKGSSLHYPRNHFAIGKFSRFFSISFFFFRSPKKYKKKGKGEVANVDMLGSIVEIRQNFIWTPPKGANSNLLELKNEYLSELRRFCEGVNWIRYIHHVSRTPGLSVVLLLYVSTLTDARSFPR